MFRTDPESERHRGLTYFLMPLDADGVTVRGFGRLDGDEGFAEVFLDDAFVPDDDGTADSMDRGGILIKNLVGIPIGIPSRAGSPKPTSTTTDATAA